MLLKVSSIVQVKIIATWERNVKNITFSTYFDRHPSPPLSLTSGQHISYQAIPVIVHKTLVKFSSLSI